MIRTTNHCQQLLYLNIGIYKPFYYHTIDGGNTWAEVSFPESDHHYLDIEVVDNDSWFLSLTNRNYITPNDKIYKTVDAGTNWQEVTLPSLSALSTIVLRDMHWFSPNEGLILASTEFLGAYNHIFRTIDAGATWQEITLDQGIAPFFSKIPNLVMKFNGDEGIISGATGNILYSTDRGSSWQTLRKGFPDVYDLSSNDGITYAATYGGTLLKYQNGMWTEIKGLQNSQNQDAAFEKITNYGQDKVALKDVFGEIHLSLDGGNTWVNLFTNQEDRVLDIQFINDQLTALVYNTTTNELRYYPNAQNAQSVEVVGNTSTPSSVFDLFYVNDLVYARVENTLFKREAGTWENVSLPGYFFRSLQMDKVGNAIIADGSNIYHYSNDLGSTWLPITFSTEILNLVDPSLTSIPAFGKINDTLHYAILYGSISNDERYNSYLITSSDNGATWQLEDSAQFGEANETGRVGHAVDNSGNLWIGSTNGEVYKWALDIITNVETPLNETVTIYPTITYNFIYLSHYEEIQSYEIFNTSGLLFKSNENITDSQIAVSKLKSNLYLLRVIYKNGETKTFKFIKQ
jgi:hypothetical protein